MEIFTKIVKLTKNTVRVFLIALFGLFNLNIYGSYSINTIAGNGTYDTNQSYFTTNAFTESYSGASIAALSVQLANPYAVVKDVTDNSLVFIDHDHYAIRAISAAGVTSTVLSGFNLNDAGNYIPQYLAIDSTTGSLYSTDGQNIFSIPKSSGSYSAPVILATSNTSSSSGTNSGALGWSSAPSYDAYCWYNTGALNPQGIAYASVNGSSGPFIYVSGQKSNTIVQIDLNTSNLNGGIYYHTTIVTGLNSPRGLALSTASNSLYVIDNPASAGWAVRGYAVPYTDGGASTAASGGDIVAGSASSSGSTGDGGAATSATLASPTNIQVDSDGSLYIADTGNNRIRYVAGITSGSYTAGYIYTIVGGGVTSYTSNAIAATNAQLSSPIGLFVDSGRAIFITEGAFGNPYIDKTESK